MLTGELPIGRCARPSHQTPLDPRVDDVVLRTLEKERERRVQSAGEVKSNVEHLTQTGAAVGPAAPASAPPHVGPAGTIVVPPADPPPLLSQWSRRAVWGAG